MEAKVQYNDLKGTACADVEDWYNNNLQSYLEKTYPAYDTDIYMCVGCEIYIGQKYANITFICRDNTTGEHVKMHHEEKEYTLNEIFDIFKRFDIVIGRHIEEVNIPEGTEYINLV